MGNSLGANIQAPTLTSPCLFATQADRSHELLCCTHIVPGLEFPPSCSDFGLIPDNLRYVPGQQILFADTLGFSSRSDLETMVRNFYSNARCKLFRNGTELLYKLEQLEKEEDHHRVETLEKMELLLDDAWTVVELGLGLEGKSPENGGLKVEEVNGGERRVKELALPFLDYLQLRIDLYVNDVSIKLGQLSQISPPPEGKYPVDDPYFVKLLKKNGYVKFPHSEHKKNERLWKESKGKRGFQVTEQVQETLVEKTLEDGTTTTEKQVEKYVTRCGTNCKILLKEAEGNKLHDFLDRYQEKRGYRAALLLPILEEMVSKIKKAEA